MYTPNSKWTWSFLLVATVQAIIGLGLEAYVVSPPPVSLTRPLQTSYGLEGALKASGR